MAILPNLGAICMTLSGMHRIGGYIYKTKVYRDNALEAGVWKRMLERLAVVYYAEPKLPCSSSILSRSSAAFSKSSLAEALRISLVSSSMILSLLSSSR